LVPHVGFLGLRPARVALRLGPPPPRAAGRWHRWQHLYVWVAYPALHIAFQLGDITSLLTNKTVGAELVGASTLGERCLGGGGRLNVRGGVGSGTGDGRATSPRR
jgi:hypothetical protein